MEYRTVTAYELRSDQIVIVDGQPHRIMFTTLVRGLEIELTLKSTISRMSPEFTRTFRKFETLLKVV